MTTTYANALWGGAATCGTAAPGSSFYTVIDETTKWGDLMMGDFGRHTGPAVSYKPYDPMDLYADMAEYPWQYGDDMLDVWEPLDEQLRETDSQRVEAYWRDRDVREKAEQARVEERVQRVKRAEASRRAAFLAVAQEAAMKGARRWIQCEINAFVSRMHKGATTIQALVRGYLVRCNNPHLDCCMCLSHRISPLKTRVGHMCRDCGNAGPFTDIVEGDGWNWFRSFLPCLICRKVITDYPYGRNPFPLCEVDDQESRVCGSCHASFVLPARLRCMEADIWLPSAGVGRLTRTDEARVYAPVYVARLRPSEARVFLADYEKDVYAFFK